MAKKPLTKAKAKPTAKSKSASSKKSTAKKSSSGGNKKIITEKERALRQANAIANSEKKKSTAGKRPKKTSTPKQTSSLLDAIVEGLQEKKAKNITILDLSDIENRVTDYFVIADADSKTHVNSIADSVEETVEKTTKERAYHSEGRQNGEWILVDYINIVVHVFLREMREFYNIEGLWGDAKITLINN